MRFGMLQLPRYFSNIRSGIANWFVAATIIFGVAVIVGVIAMRAPYGNEHRQLSHDAYIWQRVWTPAVKSAVLENASVVNTWRVLAAEARPNGGLTLIKPDMDTLRQSSRPVTLVIRIDGQLRNFDRVRLQEAVITLNRQWKSSGILVAAVEIDYDCATSRLPEYTEFLSGLRMQLDADVKLSITALPAWLGSKALPELLTHPDESVLQVHSVSHPGAGGLFDSAQASQWINDYARTTGRGFRVALPTYSSRVGLDAEGDIAYVESESPIGRESITARELFVSPHAVKDLMQQINQSRPNNLLGYAWFRLPVQTDRRAWTAATWRALVLDQPLDSKVAFDVTATQDAKLFNLAVRNPGATDVMLPTRIRLPKDCEDADGANDFIMESQEGNLWLSRHDPPLLQPGSEIAIGWVRCGNSPRGEIHAEG
jgi:hypothetical protein